MKCEKIEELLSPYLENELSPEEKRLVEEHLESCKECRLLFSSLEEAQRSLSRFPELEVSERLSERLYSIPAKKKRFRLSFDFLLRPSLQPILAAATVLLTLISFYAFNPNRKAIDKSIDRQFHLGLNKVEKLYAKAESFTSNLGEYKDDILTSLKNIKIFGGTEE
jgi:predicted anti-sigma-YlaC factor YlaD